MKNNKKGAIFFILISILLFFLLIINISDIFSSIITKQKSIFINDKIEISSQCVYAVSAYDFMTKEEAESSAIQVENNGGMGLVYKNGEYFVLASCYPTLIEAQEIKDNLLLLGYNAKILNIKIDSLSFDYNGENADFIKTIFNSFREIFLKLYEIDIDYDKDLLNKANINGRLAVIIMQNNDFIKKLDETKTSLSNEEKGILKQAYLDINEFLNNIILSNYEKLQLTSLIKKSMMEIVFIYQNVFSSF